MIGSVKDMSAAALGAILSASRLGKLADRVGHWNVIVGCLAVSALLLVPQAFVSSGWQLVVLRFLMGLSLGGLLPCIASVIRHNVPERVAGNMKKDRNDIQRLEDLKGKTIAVNKGSGPEIGRAHV